MLCCGRRPALCWRGCLPIFTHRLWVRATCRGLPPRALAACGRGSVCSVSTLALPHHRAPLNAFSSPMVLSFLRTHLFVPALPSSQPPAHPLLPSPLPSLCDHSLPTGPRRALSWLKTPIKGDRDTDSHQALCEEGQLEAGLARASSGTCRKTLSSRGVGA